MKIVTPHYILLENELSTDLSVAFDTTIRKIAPFDTLIKEYPDAEVTTLQKYSLLMPGLINAHVHIEFSGNKTSLSYGNFIGWLYSVIEKREDLITHCHKDCMQKAIDMMLDAGITTFGAVSSHCMDLEVCANAKQNVVFFNELIGSQAIMADTLFQDFMSRLESSKAINREGFYPAIAIHSPYSVHPVLVKKALEIVRNENFRLTSHFMESEAEREWLDNNEGDFKEFFEKLLKQNSAVCKPEEFLRYFDDIPTLFTHVVEANCDELSTITNRQHTIIHCPISNRLLGNKTLDLKNIKNKNINWVVATDGLSSNYILDLFEEMKIALFMQSEMNLLDLAKELLNAVTINAAEALGLNTGAIKEGKNADMIVVDLDTEATDELAIHLILHRYNISKVFINGNLAKGN